MANKTYKCWKCGTLATAKQTNWACSKCKGRTYIKIRDETVRIVKVR